MTRLSNLAAQTLQRQIHDGHFAPGGLLPSQRELAATLNISRASLREAISTLEALGLVRAQPGKGVFITAGRQRATADLPAGPADVRPEAVFQFRAVVEPAAAALAAITASAAQRTALAAIQTRMEDALRRLDLVEASDADLSFHLEIAALSGNEMLSQVIHQLEAPIAYSLRLPFADPGGIWAPADEHRAVLNAILASDGEAARAAMLHHLVRAAARIGTYFDMP
ncbi:FadR/GntR family transcriptional regulator [Andreprevotia chitinilytica]|uniref:FadR/GntR family transcriptional regulator n=1 Tax=Andreprevotia chitinilytica TaxID=396808 RepID=UPI00054F033D|nr:FCD domain-containing protein [Andreprevotia chitinilytica]